MGAKDWPVACPFINRFEECRVSERANGLVTIIAEEKRWHVPEFEYDRRAAAHAAKHAEQRAKFQASAPAPWLGWMAWWYAYIRGYFKHGAFRNPLEAEARLAEDRRAKTVSDSG